MRRVVYIGGAARSGSTLFSEVLGAQRRVLSAGELSLFWRDAERGGRCACGASIPDCEFWGVVLDRIRASHDVQPDEYARLAATRAALGRTTRPHRLASLRAHPETMSVDERRLVDATTALMDCALRESDSSVLIDSSKTLPSMLFHELCGSVDLRLIHFIRDPRPVVASTVRSRGIVRGNSESLPPGGSALTGIARWSWANATISAGAKAAPRRMLVSYEAFLADPGRLVRTVCDFAGVDFDPQTITGNEVHLNRLSHAAVGNPRRGAKDPILKNDDRWRNELTPVLSRFIRAVTWPVQAALEPIGRYQQVER